MATTERLAAIKRALEHPQFYDGDMGADIRWLLRCVERWIPRNQEEVAMTGHFLDRITELKHEVEDLKSQRDASLEVQEILERVSREARAQLDQLLADHSEALKFAREMSIQPCPHWCASDCLACRTKAWLHEAHK